MSRVLRHLRNVVLLPAGGPPDAQLLESFLARRDEAAFAALLLRHGPMVLALCRRVLRNAQDAEDAFQATFLVLAKKAGSIRSRQVLASWLYGVAYRTAMKARALNARRRAKERQAAAMSLPQTPADESREELLEQLDHELARLPDKYRLPVVLCELQGKGRKEAAQLLGLPEGTLSWRLARARKLLARKLSRHGVPLSAGTVAVLLTEGAASARLPPALLTSTAEAVLTAGAVPARVVALTEGVMRAMLLTKLKITACVAALALLAGVGATGLAYQDSAGQPRQTEGYGARPVGRAESRPAADDLESLRLEIDALRKELRATRERLKALEARVERQQGPGGALPKQGRGGALPKGLDREALPKAKSPPTDVETQPGPRGAADPLAGAEEALKRLRADPDDRQAAEALERALRRLKGRSRPDVPTDKRVK